MNKAQVAPYLMPIVYAVVAVIVVVGLAGIAIRALSYGAWDLIKGAA